MGHQCSYHKGRVAIRHYVNQKKLRRWIVSGTREDTDDHGPGVDWLVSPPHLTLTPLLHASCHGSAASDPPANTSQLSSDTPRESCGGGFPSVLNPTERPRRGQELQCYRNLTFVPVSPILKVFLFSDGPSQPTSIPKYVSATNVLRDGYRGHIHCSTSTLHSILITVSPILVCVFVDRPLWSPLDPDIARLLVLPIAVSVLRV